MQDERVQLRQGKNVKHVHCSCRVAEDVDVRVGEGEVIYDPLYRIANVLSCTRELNTQVDEAVVGDDGDNPSSSEERTEVVVDDVGGRGEHAFAHVEVTTV